MICQYFPTNTVVAKERTVKSLESKILAGRNKNEFFLSFLKAFIQTIQNNIEKIAQFLSKEKLKFKKH